jgi:hypothetical protein
MRRQLTADEGCERGPIRSTRKPEHGDSPYPQPLAKAGEQQREDHFERQEAFAEWMRHVDAGRIGEGVKADEGGGVEEVVVPQMRTFSLNSPEAYAALGGRRRWVW